MHRESKVSCPRTQHNVPGQDPNPDHSNPESSALTMRPPRLPQERIQRNVAYFTEEFQGADTGQNIKPGMEPFFREERERESGSGVLTSDPTLTREGKLQRYLRELRKKGHFDPEVYEAIYPSGSQPSRIYGLPKMHKPRAPNSTPPFRPIVSSIGTYNYSLAKYLSNLLQPHIPSTFIASDSFSLL